MPNDPFAAMLAETAAFVKDQKWSLLAISGGEGQPSFHYTVCLHGRGLPELISFGLPYETGALLNALGNRLCEPDYRIEDGMLVEQIIKGYAVKLRLLGPLAKFHDEEELEHFGYLMRFARHQGSALEKLEVVHMLWPDKEGRFPDDPASPMHGTYPLLRGARDSEDRAIWS